jgi:DNA-binding NarL/FixJ family response regulator
MTRSPTPVPHKILVVDSHPLYAEGLAQLIAAQSDMLLCGQATSPNAALQVIREQQPDLVVVSLELDHRGSLELLRSLSSEFPATGILVMADAGEPQYVERSLRAGASGFILKTASEDEVLRGVRAILQGDIYLQNCLISPLLRAVLRPVPHNQRFGIERLTDRELRVLELIGDGLATGEIARRLSISRKTVDSHRENIKRKLDLKNAAALTRFACEWTQRQPASSAPPTPPQRGVVRDKPLRSRSDKR